MLAIFISWWVPLICGAFFYKIKASFSGFLRSWYDFIFSKILDAPVSRVATEDKYGSNVNMEPDSPTDEDKKAKQDEGKTYLLPDLFALCSNSSR